MFYLVFEKCVIPFNYFIIHSLFMYYVYIFCVYSHINHSINWEKESSHKRNRRDFMISSIFLASGYSYTYTTVTGWLRHLEFWKIHEENTPTDKWSLNQIQNKNDEKFFLSQFTIQGHDRKLASLHLLSSEIKFMRDFQNSNINA